MRTPICAGTNCATVVNDKAYDDHDEDDGDDDGDDDDDNDDGDDGDC